MNVLSLFDGMSCGQLALQRANIPYDKYFASEVDKWAIKVTQSNHPDTIQLGDVSKVRATDLPPIDLIMGGSPCQGFSLAGNQLAFDDPRSQLFFEFVRLVKECKPKYFLLENVRMKKEWQDIISEYLGVEPIMINSSLMSAQNRVRYYWTNIPGITQPEDKLIKLIDIYEGDVDVKYDCTESIISRVLTAKRGKGYFYNPDTHQKIGTVIAGYYKYPTDGCYIECGASRGRYNDDGSTSQRLEIRKDAKTNALTTVQKDNLLIEDRTKYRRLTPLECERLQTVPEGYTSGVSDTQRYRMLGNGWTVDIISHILKNIN
jgi:site-specific DNA-cytosine methylase